MICIFQGPTPMNLIASDVQTAIQEQVVACEHSPDVQERQDGCYDFQTRPETLDELHARLARENNVGVPVIQDMIARNVGGLDPTPQQVVTGETLRPGTREVLLSPNLVKDDGSPVQLADFPDNFSFGNGVTTNSWVTLRDGSVRVLSWVVFPDASEASVRANEAALRQLVEG